MFPPALLLTIILAQPAAPEPATPEATTTETTTDETAATPPASAPAATAAPVASPKPAPDATPTEAMRAGDEPLLETTPRQFFIGLGYSVCVLDKLPGARGDVKPHPQGLAIFANYLWQVGGLGRRSPSWIGFHMGLDVFPAAPASRQVLALGYGLYVKHGLGRPKRVRPFVAYGLGAVQAFVKDIEGRGIGHQTLLAIGMDIPLRGMTSLSFSVTYKYQSLPAFRLAETDTRRWDFHVLMVLAGATFDFPRRFKPPRRKRTRAA